MKYLEPPYKITTHLLWWQRRGLQQTASGYGCKLTTHYMLETPDGRKRRVYAMCFSNAASHYVIINGETFMLRDSDLDAAREVRQ